MEFNQEDIKSLFELKKFPCDEATINFPMQGEYIEIELQNDTGRIRFQADVNRANKIASKITFQLRHQKTYTIRRLDLNGNHKNPPAPIPNKIFEGYEDYIFDREDHVHFYVEGYNERWALPLSKVATGILETDDIYDKMSKFFKYCHVENLDFKVIKSLNL